MNRRTSTPVANKESEMSQPPLPDRPTLITDPVFNEWFAKQQADILWFLGQHEVLARYPGQVVVLHNRIVIGSGRDHLEAMADARRQTAQRGEPLPDAWRMLFIPVQDPNSFSF